MAAQGGGKQRRAAAWRRRCRPRPRRCPCAISVNMLRLRVVSEAQPRSKNGQPAHSTTGVASASCTQFDACGPSSCAGRRDGRPSPAANTGSGQRQADPEPPRHVGELGIGRRRRPSTSSGSSAMPQIGQAPGPPGGSRDASGRCRSCRRAPLGSAACAAAGARYCAGSATNFSRQPARAEIVGPARVGGAVLGGVRDRPSCRTRGLWPHGSCRRVRMVVMDRCSWSCANRSGGYVVAA